MPSARTLVEADRNHKVQIRLNQEEILAARKLGTGNVSMGLKLAIRYAMNREMAPIKLSTLLRAAALMAQDTEDLCKQLKSDAVDSLAKRRSDKE